MKITGKLASITHLKISKMASYSNLVDLESIRDVLDEVFITSGIFNLLPFAF